MTFEMEKDKPIGKVLIVEDTPIAAKIADILLQEQGCLTLWVKSGEEALTQLTADFSFILMDLGLPGLDGFETARHIRQGSANTANIPIIALTAHQDGPAVDRAKDIGMNGFLSKPINREKTTMLINAFIREQADRSFLTQQSV